MIRSTYCHLQGVGEVTERRLWEAGATSWEAALAGGLPARWQSYAERIAASAEALADRDWDVFRAVLKGRHAWRWYRELQDRAVYLDIETTGGPCEAEAVTVIACYDGQDTNLFVRGDNLRDFPLFIAEYDLMVTYNGQSFDVPYLHARFPHLHLPAVHLDLRHPLAALGFRGGLKQVELDTGLARDEDLHGVDGWTAVLLWDRHLRGDERALPTLLRYATEDVLGLEPLAQLVYNRHSAALPLAAEPVVQVPRRANERWCSFELLAELGYHRPTWRRFP